MEFDLGKSLEILERTPSVLSTLLNGLNDDWIVNNEGGDTWSPYVVTGHLVYAEKADWMPRVKAIIQQTSGGKFPPFDRFGQFEDSKGKNLGDLLDEFAILRAESLQQLGLMITDEKMLDDTGIHPEFGVVTLRQLLSTWVVHDLGHLAQIARVMAKQYKQAVGPWSAYLSIVR